MTSPRDTAVSAPQTPVRQWRIRCFRSGDEAAWLELLKAAPDFPYLIFSCSPSLDALRMIMTFALVDLAWIFEGWDGVQAQLKGVDLSLVRLYGSCVPDYYTPVIIAGQTTLAEKGDLARRFLAATSRGYVYAAENPEEAAEILLKHRPERDRNTAPSAC